MQIEELMWFPKSKQSCYNIAVAAEILYGVLDLEWWSERLSFVLCWPVSWTRAGAIHACWPRGRKEREDKEEDPPPPPPPPSPNTLFLCSVMSLSFFPSLRVSLFLSCLTHIASLHSSLTAALSLSYLPLLKPLALCLSAGLMLNWTRHYPSLSNTHKHTPRLSWVAPHTLISCSAPPLAMFLFFSPPFCQIFSLR